MLLSTLETRPRPVRALRCRVQHDTHGLDESLHSLGIESGSLLARIDCHGAAAPQVVGALVGLSCLGDRHRLELCRPPRTPAPGGGGFTDLVDWLDSSPPEMGLPASERERMWALRELGIEVVDVRDAR